MTFGQILALIVMFYFIMAMVRYLFPVAYRIIDWICGIVGVAIVLYWLFYGIHKVFGVSW